ncbi:MAG: PD-(D/E)XK nuclease family protein [Culicoidibacterales bacterium]
MRFQYIIGRSGVGKSELAMKQFINHVQQGDGKTPYFYLVPDQMSFQTELQLLQRFETQSASNVFVYSFKNIVNVLISTWLQQTGQDLHVISDLGMQMLIRKVLVEHTNEWQVYERVAKQPGFSAHILDCLHEFHNWQVTLEQEHIETFTNDQALRRKLHDILLIRQYVKEQLDEKGVMTQQQQLQQATQLLANKNVVNALSLSNAVIVIDGFHSFNKLEQQFIQTLAQVVAKTTLVLTLDRPYDTIEEYEQSETFLITGKTYWQMCQFTHKTFQPTDVQTIWLDSQQHQRSEQKALQQLEKWLADRGSFAQETPLDNEDEAIQIIGGMNRLREVEAVAQHIRNQVIHGARYQDVAVYVSQPSEYYQLIRRIFPLYDLPFFLDEKTPMYFHPILECILGSLAVVKHNWQYEDIFRTVKTGFFNSEQLSNHDYFEQIAFFENYCIRRGKFGRKHWHEHTQWTYRISDTIEHLEQPLTDVEQKHTEQITHWRTLIVIPLQQFESAIKQAQTVQDFSIAVFTLLEYLQVPQQLFTQMQNAESEGELVKAKQDQQVWQQLVTVFEEIVTISGDDTIDLTQFISILETGFEQLTFQLAPPSLDYVLIGDFERARFQMAQTDSGMGIQYTYVLGLNEGSFPFFADQTGLLTQAEREQFEQANIQLAPDLYGSLASQQLNFYLLVANTKKQVVLSYVLADGESGEKEQYPAQIIQEITHQFGVQTRLFPQQLGEIYAPFSLTPKASYRYLHYHLAQALQGKELGIMWQATYNWLITHDEQAYFIRRSLDYKNIATRIDPMLVKRCFGDKISGTATRIETYNRCPYRFYTQYMLGLQDEQTYKISFLQIGNLYHYCLEFIAVQLFERKYRFAQLTEQEIVSWTKESLQQLQPYLHYHAFYENARSEYLLKKLEQNVLESVRRLVEIDQHSQFDLRFAEVSFGQKQSIFAAREYILTPEYTLSLRGKIDRIDTLETETGTYVRIIDYKSTDKSVDFDEIYHGLSLQMPMYLDVATQDILPNSHPAGMFYFTIQNKKANISLAKAQEYIGHPQQQLLGYAIDDATIISQMDDTLLHGATDYIKGIKQSKTGFYKTSPILSAEELTNLTTFTNEKIRSSAELIIAGEVPIEPKGIEKLPCEYCPYRTICQFDQQLPENPGCYVTSGHREAVLMNQKNEEE